MSDFRDYFNTRLNQEIERNAQQGISTKYQEVQAASDLKIKALNTAIVQQKQLDLANANSLVGQLELDEQGLAAQAVNLGASIYSGASRVVGDITGFALGDVPAMARSLSLSEDEISAIGRHKQGIATPADLELINRQKREGSDSPLQTFDKATLDRQRSADIDAAFDRSDLVHQGRRNELREQLGENFQSAWDQVKTGASSLWEGDVTGSKDLISGLTKLVYNAGEAAVTNPGAAAEYIAENIPQLAIGAFGTVGKAALLTSNAGYASEEYQKGIAKYQAENQSAYPPEAERQKMAAYAASLALAEQVTDTSLLKGAMGAADAAKATARTGFIQSMKNIAKVGAGGVVTEAATEGWQTFAEGEANRTEVSAQDIYEGMTIGGIAGGGLAGGGRALGEMLKATPEHVAERAKDAKEVLTRAQAQEAAIQSGDVTALVDRKSEVYDPARAIAALHGNSSLPETTEEAKQTNLVKATEIVAELEAERVRVQAAYDDVNVPVLQKNLADAKAVGRTEVVELLQTSLDEAAKEPGADKRLKLELSKLDRRLEMARENLNRFNTGLATAVSKDIDVDAQVEAINTPVDSGDVAAVTARKQEVDTLINLSMAVPERLGSGQARALADNADNGLSENQRIYLRSFSDARIAENQLKSMDQVSQEIYAGGNGNVGIAQYRQRIATALAAGNKIQAAQQLTMLRNFRDDHQAKAAVIAEAWEEGKGTQIGKPADSPWLILPKRVTRAQLKLIKGLEVNTEKLVNDIRIEADAISKALAELDSAFMLKFNTTNAPLTTGAKNVPDVSQAHGKTQAKPAAKQEAQAVGSAAAPSTGRVSGTGGAAAPVEAAGVVIPAAIKRMPDTELNDALNDAMAKPGYQNSMRFKQLDAEMSLRESAAAEQDAPRADEDTDLPPWVTEDIPADETPSGASVSVKGSGRSEGQPQSTNPTSTEPAEDSPAVGTVEESTVEVVADAATESGQLQASITKSPEGTPYNLRNLIADYFTQTASREGDSTQRPMVAVKNFLSQAWDKVGEYLPFKGLTEEQDNLLSFFKEVAAEFDGTFQSNLVRRDRKFWYEDLIQFLMVEGPDGQLDLEENTKTAMTYAAVSWIAENATRSAANTPAEMNAILGQDEDERLSPEQERALLYVGTRQNVIFNALGQRAVQALGLKATKDAPVDLMPKLESSLGAHIGKMLLDRGILERTTLSAQEMAELMGKPDTAGEESHYFVKLARVGKDFELNAEAEQIFKANMGTSNLLDKLFSVEPGMKAPSTEPIPFTQAKTRNTNQGVPTKLGKVLGQKNAEASFVRGEMYDVVQHIDEDLMLDIAGAEDTDENTTHKANRSKRQATNDGLKRELQNIKNFVLGMDDIDDTPLYFEHTAWKQQRVGISTNLVNPQTSKIHRHMLYRKSWETVVELSDPAQMLNFSLRVAEGLGVRTDQMDQARAIEGFAKKLANPTLQAAVKILQKRLAGADLSRSDQETLRDAVQAGGEKLHSLSSLMVLAQAVTAQESGQPSFTVRLMGEIDGVTNGPMLSHLMLGAASSVQSLIGLLNRGGFFELGNKHENYNLWRGDSAAGHFDLYETTSGHMVESIRGLISTGIKNRFGKVVMNGARVGQVMSNIYAFTGDLTLETPDSQKKRRNIIKTPLTAMVFGSSVGSAVDSMADNFVESIYAAIEDTLKEKAGSQTEQQLVERINLLLSQGKGPMLKPGTTLADLKEHVFSKAEIKALKKIFSDTVGAAVKETMETDFQEYIDKRRTINLAAQTTFGLYDRVYQALREEMIQKLIESGEIATKEVHQKDANGKAMKHLPTIKEPIRDLNQAQEAELRERLRKLEPVAHTAFSKEQGDDGLRAGLAISKSSRKLSTKPTFQGHAKFATPFPDNGAKSTVTRGYETVASAPGVAMVPMLAHSTDSFISHLAAALSEVLNIHDAHGSGLSGFEQTARNLNQATWTAMLDYSPAGEIQAALSRTVQGLAELVQSGDLSPEALASIQATLTAIAAKQKMDPKELVNEMMYGMKDTAFKADDMKLQVLEQLQSIDQYALQGGNYAVTDEDRAAATARRAKLSRDLSEQEKAATEAVTQALWGEAETVTEKPDSSKTELPLEEDPPWDVDAKAKPAANPFGEIGSPDRVDARLVGFFTKNPEPTAEVTIRALMDMVGPGPGYHRVLLELLLRAMPKNVKVKLITPEMTLADVILPPGVSGPDWQAKGETIKPAFGWIVGNEIYVLSQGFTNSGLQTPEVLLHELVHGALVQLVERELTLRYGPIDPNTGERDSTKANPKYKSAALNLVQRLESLMTAAAAHAKEQGITKFDAALSDVHEFIAYGMTRTSFQRFLAEVSVVDDATPKSNVLINGFKRFINTLTDLLFDRLGLSGVLKNTQVNTALGQLITNVTGLVNQAEKDKGKAEAANVNLSSTVDPVGTLNRYSTLDIHEALNAGDVSPEFDAKLRNLLTGIVEKIHGPFGAFKAALMDKQALTPVDVWLKALDTGVAPFASSIDASPFKTSARERHAMEQVEVTVRAALERNEVTAKSAYRELKKLFAEASQFLKPSDFASQEEYDFIFKIELDAQGKSHHLARFVAFGLANEEFNKKLQRSTKTDLRLARSGKTFAERVQILFEQVLEFFHGQVTGTYGGQQADFKLNRLVEHLVDVEAKKIRTLARPMGPGMLDLAGEKLKAVAEAGRKKAAQALDSDFIANNRFATVRTAGNYARVVVKDQVEGVLKGISELRNRHNDKKYGLAMGLLTDIVGPGRILNTLSLASTAQQRERKSLIVNTESYVLDTFANGGRDLNKQAKNAITQVFLRTGMHGLLGDFNMAQLEQLVSDKTARDATIKTLEDQLAGLELHPSLREHFINKANALAYAKVTGINRDPMLMMSAHNIVQLYGTSKNYRKHITDAQVSQAQPIVEQLVALYALGYVDQGSLDNAKEVMKTEAARPAGQGNGVEFTLALHKRLEQEAQERLFKGQQALMMHGYTPEIYNPHTEVQTATAAEGKELEDMGYTRLGQVELDPGDPDREQRSLYVLKDGGMSPFRTGIMSYTGRSAKGSTKHNGFMNVNTADGAANASKQADISASRTFGLSRGPRQDLSKVKGVHMAPVLNPQGEVVNWRYMMQDKTKDLVLDRDNRFDKVLGMLAGSIYDKETSTEINTQAITALKEAYDAEEATQPEAYINVGPASPDAEMREMWSMLPDATKDAARRIFGSDGMYVRKDALTVVFGYRQYSLASMFMKDPDARGHLENLFVAGMKHVLNLHARVNSRTITDEEAERYAKRVAVAVMKGERIWQELVHEVKDIIVVKSGLVLLGNIWSNLFFLAISGVPLKDILKSHLVALRGTSAYHSDTERLAALQAQIDTGVTNGKEAEIRRQIAQLKDSLERNPVKELIDAGLMPTIAEDVVSDDDIYSYKGALVRKVEEATSDWNPAVLGAARQVYMAHDTKMYQGLRRLTQVSDFVARYALYQHLTTRTQMPLSKEEAIFQASDSFINYDIPMHKGMQYMDDMGFHMFTKYFLRVQRVLMRSFRDNPARVLMTLLLQNFMDLGPIVLDSHWIHKVGNNPFSMGAFQLPGTIDDLATVSATMALVK